MIDGRGVSSILLRNYFRALPILVCSYNSYLFVERNLVKLVGYSIVRRLLLSSHVFITRFQISRVVSFKVLSFGGDWWSYVSRNGTFWWINLNVIIPSPSQFNLHKLLLVGLSVDLNCWRMWNTSYSDLCNQTNRSLAISFILVRITSIICILSLTIRLFSLLLVSNLFRQLALSIHLQSVQ